MRHSTSNWGVDTRKKRMRLVRTIALTIPIDMCYGCTSFSWSDHPQNAAALLIWGLTTWTKVIRHLHFKKHPPQRNWHCGDINSILRRRSDADLSLTQKNHFISFQNLRPQDGSRHLTDPSLKARVSNVTIHKYNCLFAVKLGASMSLHVVLNLKYLDHVTRDRKRCSTIVVWGEIYDVKINNIRPKKLSL